MENLDSQFKAALDSIYGQEKSPQELARESYPSCIWTPELRAGYRTLIGLSDTKGLTPERLFQEYRVLVNADSVSLFFNCERKAGGNG